MAAAIAIAVAVAGVAEACPDVLELVTECIESDHQRTVGDEAALAAVAVVADQVVELAVSVVAVCLLGLYGAGVDFGHVEANDGVVFKRWPYGQGSMMIEKRWLKADFRPP